MDPFTEADAWITSDCWLACFDILGFRNLMAVDQNGLRAFSVRVDYEETIDHLRKDCTEYFPGSIDYAWFSDTFLMFTKNDSAPSYAVIQSAAKRFITNCTCSRVPLRGAISVGSFMRTKDNREFIGNAFLEAFEYGEDQDWVGLLLTPSAVKKVEALGLDPTHHDFVRSHDIPMRKFKGQRDSILAYRFQNGTATFSSPVLPMLRDMKLLSPKNCRRKYERAEKFICKHYRWLRPEELRHCPSA